MTRSLALLLLLLVQPINCRRLQAPPPGDTIPPDFVVQAQTLAGSDPQDLLAEYGDFQLPSSYDALPGNCGINWNANRTVCDRLIGNVVTFSNRSCDCYNFCDGELSLCYNFGEIPAPDCDQQQHAVLGCHVNYTPPVYNSTAKGPEPCPKGYMCSRDSMQLCEYIRAIPVVARLGDVHAGMFCNGSDDRTVDNGYTLCDPGFYCPNSTTRFPCPAGFYCPHKTAKPEIKCPDCKEGDTSLQREWYGYFVVGCALALFLAFMIWTVVLNRNKNLARQLADLQSQSMYAMSNAMEYKNRRAKLQKLKPKLLVIEKRMKAMENMDVRSSGVAVSDRADGNVQFNAHKLFDALDVNGDRELSYKELNHVLQLEPAALREFTNRMNQAAREPPGTNTISRAVFARFFLTALEASSHFEPTAEEAAQLYDQLTLEAKAQHFDCDGGIPREAFYKCASLNFLTQPQILELENQIEALCNPAEEHNSTRSRRGSFQSTRSGFQKSTIGFSLGRAQFSRKIQRNDFIVHYPTLLLKVTDTNTNIEKEGVDIAFENLSLTVKKGKEEIRVVNDVTGRLRSGTMTALMGGSGAGKTSLLNALCGRAHYGEVTGNIMINGQKSSIEDHADSVGFVPQDDIVFPELTVRENLIYSGKFQLPRGTPIQEIEDLADKSLAGLGLSRVQHNMVGDVNRRGVSGGEKKRVNIGLELMSRPKILFLDEPTSGLDSSSAMLVMQSMKTLVETQGITVCSVIHQPRKTIFELFDSLVLLGAGGFLVYHGKVRKAQRYFMTLGYDLPEGESLADWLIDISTGTLKQNVGDDDHENNKKKMPRTTDDEDEFDTDDEEFLNLRASRVSESSEGDDPELLATDAEKESARRDFLYKAWRRHFRKLSKKKKSFYQGPKPFDLPSKVDKPGFFSQLGYQIHRLFLLARRNWYAKLLDTTIIVVAVIIISALDGVVTPTEDADMNGLDFYAVAEPSGTIEHAGIALVKEFPTLFSYALTGNLSVRMYVVKLGVLIALLVGLTATKIVAEKRNEFFREAGSGYNINAYFVAVNIVSTIEHSLQVIFSSLFALWLRNSIARWYSYYINFLLVAWITVSWALLFPLLVQPKSVVLITGFYCIFFGLLLSGGISPVTYEDIYNNTFIALLSGLLSPTRFFIEAMVVAESRCLPVQSGFTNLGETLLGNEEAIQVASFQIVSQGLNDFGNAIQRGCKGWYWGALPAFVVGLTVRWIAGGINHLSGRAQQSKKPILTTLARNKSSQAALALYLFILIGLIALSVWLILRKASSV